MASANNPNIPFYIPGGRFIFGSVSQKQTTDKDGRPLEPAKQYYLICVAVPKLINGAPNPELPAAMGAPYQAACNYYGQHQGILPKIQQGIAGPFKFKIDDGDTVMNKDGTGLRWGDAGRGCYVFKLRSNFDNVKTSNAQNIEIAPSECKCGYYVDVSASTSANELLDHNAGVYLNPIVVRVIGYGPEITSSVDVSKAFTGTYNGPTLPGMSTMPVAPVSSGLPGASVATGLPQPAQSLPGLPMAAPVVPQAAALPVPQPANVMQPTGFPTNVTPHTAFVGGGMPGM